MPTFDTPEPISLVLELVVADVGLTATERVDTVVEVRPSDAAREVDVRAAEQTRVEFLAGRLLVKAPKSRYGGLFGKVGSIDVRIGLPAGSQLQAAASVAAVRCTGRLGECRIDTSVGDVQVDRTGPLELTTGAGAVVVGRVDGAAELSTGSGAVRVGEIDGQAVIKNSNGDTFVGRITGDARVHASNGDIRIDRAGGAVTARTANGNLRIGEVTRGVTSLKTALGGIEVTVSPGTAARLDLSTSFGTVRNHLDSVDGPLPADETAEVHARTSYGDIVISRPTEGQRR